MALGIILKSWRGNSRSRRKEGSALKGVVGIEVTVPVKDAKGVQSRLVFVLFHAGVI